MKNFLLILAVLFAVLKSYAQSTYLSGSPIERGNPLNEIRSQPKPLAGSVYLDEEWIVATLDLTKGTLSVNQLKDVPMKLDLKANVFELSAASGVKALEGSKVDSFHFVNPKTGRLEAFFNCNKFKLDGVPLIGFCKITGTKIRVASYSTVKFYRADYNVTLNTGRKEDEYVKNTTLYLVKDDTFFVANKKNLFELMKDKEPEIKKFVKENRISISKEEELSRVVEYYDTLAGDKMN